MGLPLLIFHCSCLFSYRYRPPPLINDKIYTREQITINAYKIINFKNAIYIAYFMRIELEKEELPLVTYMLDIYLMLFIDVRHHCLSESRRCH